MIQKNPNIVSKISNKKNYTENFMHVFCVYIKIGLCNTRSVLYYSIKTFEIFNWIYIYIIVLIYFYVNNLFKISFAYVK